MLSSNFGPWKREELPGVQNMGEVEGSWAAGGEGGSVCRTGSQPLVIDYSAVQLLPVVILSPILF